MCRFSRGALRDEGHRRETRRFDCVRTSLRRRRSRRRSARGVWPPQPAGAAPVTESFAFTGGAQEYVVPAGVCAVELDVLGAEGGDFGGSVEAGHGGRATATISVTPGEGNS